MNKGFLTVGIILLAIIALLIINVLSNYSTGSEVDYYLVKETAEAAMEDSLDNAFFAEHGVPRMDKDYYVESFVRRFTTNINTTREYKLSFYSMSEVPPKVSVKVESLTTLGVKDNEGNTEAANIVTEINELVMTNRYTNNYLEYQKKHGKIDYGYRINVDKNGNGYVEVMD
jgi:hypothetical protein